LYPLYLVLRKDSKVVVLAVVPLAVTVLILTLLMVQLPRDHPA
jgi:hypothetical protein